ncbi:YqaA family protein [Sneathiella glossodoripedis]|uniref:YqaA family protein n=1 Tax=Sneathiella glossodoripedis TaxID=418853 RepID=UPI0004725F6D|nr:YqaA family protein [Sneathiella glossodoripedis]
MTALSGLFISGLLSATLLPGSSEALLITLVAKGQEPIGLLLVVATTGNLLGSLINWIIGKYLMRFQDRKWFPVNQKQMIKAERWFNRYGLYSLLLAWLPIIGDPLTLVAGALNVRLPVFLILVLIGKLARYSLVTAGTLALI